MSNPLHTKLESIFDNILTHRMDGLPVINKLLSVKAIGFHAWNNYQLGILITPWFMNLMLIPSTDSSTTSKDTTNTPAKVGSTQNHIFPSGSYEFVTGFEEAFGHYQSCSLFSPMFEFDDQQIAELTAKEALDAIMNDENIDIDSQNPATEIEQIWNGEIPQPIIKKNFDGTEKANNTTNKGNKKTRDTPNRPLSERLQEPTSRRDFLRGKAFRHEPLRSESHIESYVEKDTARNTESNSKNNSENNKRSNV